MEWAAGLPTRPEVRAGHDQVPAEEGRRGLAAARAGRPAEDGIRRAAGRRGCGPSCASCPWDVLTDQTAAVARPLPARGGGRAAPPSTARAPTTSSRHLGADPVRAVAPRASSTGRAAPATTAAARPPAGRHHPGHEAAVPDRSQRGDPAATGRARRGDRHDHRARAAPGGPRRLRDRGGDRDRGDGARAPLASTRRTSGCGRADGERADRQRRCARPAAGPRRRRRAGRAGRGRGAGPPQVTREPASWRWACSRCPP